MLHFIGSLAANGGDDGSGRARYQAPFWPLMSGMAISTYHSGLYPNQSFQIAEFSFFVEAISVGVYYALLQPASVLECRSDGDQCNQPFHRSLHSHCHPALIPTPLHCILHTLGCALLGRSPIRRKPCRNCHDVDRRCKSNW